MQRTVLLVEAEPALRRVFGIWLERAGYRVLQAASAEPALDLLRDLAQPVDLLLCDVGSPRGRGRQVVEQARLLRRGLPVGLLTGGADPAELPPGLPVLLKPFREEELLGLARSLLFS